MKLRIKGNSLRLRLSQTELAQFADSGAVEDRIEFGPGRHLRYGLKRGTDGGLAVEFSGGVITVAVPAADAARWTGTDLVSLRGEHPLPDGALNLLIEKDFQCLAPRADEDESDLFAHPLAED